MYVERIVSHSITQLYINHHQWLINYLKKHLQQQTDIATDLVQDTFLNLLQRPEQISEIKEERAFLLTIAKRKLFNYWRRLELEHSYIESVRTLGIEDTVSAEQLCMIQDALIYIDLLLDGLPLAVKHAFLLKKLEMMTHMEIALSMNLSLATIERYIKQATIHCLIQRQKMQHHDI